MIVGGAFFFFRGRQHASRITARGLIDDANPVVLYLAPFTQNPKIVTHAPTKSCRAALPPAEMIIDQEPLACDFFVTVTARFRLVLYSWCRSVVRNKRSLVGRAQAL